jgi:hypothetical protein
MYFQKVTVTVNADRNFDKITWSENGDPIELTAHERNKFILYRKFNTYSYDEIGIKSDYFDLSFQVEQKYTFETNINIVFEHGEWFLFQDGKYKCFLVAI